MGLTPVRSSAITSKGVAVWSGCVNEQADLTITVFFTCKLGSVYMTDCYILFCLLLLHNILPVMQYRVSHKKIDMVSILTEYSKHPALHKHSGRITIANDIQSVKCDT